MTPLAGMTNEELLVVAKGPHACDGTAWDMLAARGVQPLFRRPASPSREGSRSCESGSVASGGTREYCTCDRCW